MSTPTIRSNVRVTPNTLCVRKDGRSLTEEEIAKRLHYFHLIELTRVSPLRFSPELHQPNRRTSAQAEQANTYLRQGAAHLWTWKPPVHPLGGEEIVNPFEATPRPIQPERRPAGTPAPVRSQASEPARQTGDAESLEINEQDAVVKAPPLADILVVAPPGTGKTHVLVERIAHLVQTAAASNPQEQVLVLSFTRSAVGEVRRRLRAKVASGAHPNLAYARVLTFDSLATRLLLEDLSRESLSGLDYAARIRRFLELIDESLPAAKAKIQGIKFLFVDEIQDLGGARARMVLKLACIVKASGGATTFLGDPAQAIYDFDEREQKDLSSIAFLQQLIGGDYTDAAPAKRIELLNYRRFDTREMLSLVSRARAAMGKDGLNPDGGQIDQLLNEVDRTRLAALSALPNIPGRRAILTRTNLEAFQIWKSCTNRGLNAELWRGASGAYWPGWLARLFLGFRQETMDVTFATKRWNSHVAPYSTRTADDAIQFLRDEGACDGNVIDLRALNQVVSNGSPAARLIAGSSNLVVSTIHRSKGLEFDEVLLYQPWDNAAGDAGEVRILYVAATRARKRLLLLEADPTAVRRGQKRGYQLQTSCFHITNYAGKDFGILLDGVDAIEPNSILHTGAPEATTKLAETIWSQLALATENRSPLPCTVRPHGGGSSAVCIDNRAVVALDAAANDDLRKIAAYRKTSLTRVDGLAVRDLATVAFDPDDEQAQSAFGAACLG
ncbi:MAG: ATP-dependent helicase [Betaproteobacteria bacterium]|nr:ATP-dependent helicase [Betaproteobacteria bacterium]